MTERSAERFEFLKDLVICVAEDYGTNPWRQVEAYNPDIGTITIIEIGDGDEAKRHNIDIETIARGLSRIRSGEVGINSQMKKGIVEGDKENDAGNIDAYDADMIMQAGLFGKLIYG